MSVLLDTHALLWWQAGGGRLSRHAARAIDNAPVVRVSPLSCWEIATLVRLGRVALDRETTAWVRDLLRDERIEIVPVSAEAATWAGGLTEAFAGDPIDRLIYATARDLRIPLISKDQRIHDYARGARDVKVIW
jgi:PIN domain nuclease of toxin-antitoxin system